MPCHCGHKVLSTVSLWYYCEANYYNGSVVLEHKIELKVDRHFEDIAYRIYSNSGYRYTFSIKDVYNPISLTGEHYMATPFRQSDIIAMATDILFESIYTDEYERVLHSGSWATHYLRPLLYRTKYIRIGSELIEISAWNDGLLPHYSYRVGKENDLASVQNIHPFYIPECITDKYNSDIFGMSDYDLERLRLAELNKPISNFEFLDSDMKPIKNLFRKAF